MLGRAPPRGLSFHSRVGAKDAAHVLKAITVLSCSVQRAGGAPLPTGNRRAPPLSLRRCACLVFPPTATFLVDFLLLTPGPRAFLVLLAVEGGEKNDETHSVDLYEREDCP